MRILTIASELPPIRSGVARSAGCVIDAFRAAGHTVDVLSAADARGIRRDQLRLSLVGFDLVRRRSALADYDLVHVHGPSPTISDAALLTWRSVGDRPPLIYTHHFTVVVDSRALAVPARVYARTGAALARRADVVVTTTPSYQRRMQAIGCRDVRVIPWGVDVERFAASTRSASGADDPLRILLLGQLRTYKGPLVAVAAVAGIDGIELTIVGNGPLEAELRAESLRSSNVTVRTDVDDDELPALYAEHDVVLLASTNESEAFGITLLEGMAAGCMPVASGLAGVCDIAGPTGVLVEPGDAGSLRAALVELARDRERVSAAGAASVDQAGLYSWDRTTDGYLALAAELVDERVG